MRLIKFSIFEYEKNFPIERPNVFCSNYACVVTARGHVPRACRHSDGLLIGDVKWPEYTINMKLKRFLLRYYPPGNTNN